MTVRYLSPNRFNRLFAVTLFVLCCAACSRDTPQPAQQTPANAVTSPLDRIPLTHLDGKPASLAPWQGKVIVANYWATWCPPCRAEMPEFSELHTAYAGRGVQFVGISLDEAAAVSAFSQQTPVSYPLLIAPLNAIDATVALGNQAQALPFTIILDRSGKTVTSKLGRYPRHELEAQLQALLQLDKAAPPAAN